MNSPAFRNASGDPSGDDYHYFRGTDYDQQKLGILDRYKFYNGSQGNSTGNTAESYNTIATLIPNSEDCNRNGRLDTAESYYQYKTNLTPTTLVAGENHIMEVRAVTTTFPNGVTASVHWYHFRIPVNEPDTIIGNPPAPAFAGFIRLFLKGFNTETHLRIAGFGLGYMQERAYRDMILVYPNPTQGMLTIDFNNRTPRSIKLYDHAGRLLYEQDMTMSYGHKVNVDLSALSNGIYLLKLHTDQETVVKKVVIAK